MSSLVLQRCLLALMSAGALGFATVRTTGWLDEPAEEVARPRTQEPVPLQAARAPGHPTRDLFGPIPARPAADPIVTSAVAEIGFRLVGILARTNGSLAIVEIDATHEVRRLREGDVIEGWTVSQIMTRGVLFSQKGRSKQLFLDQISE